MNTETPDKTPAVTLTGKATEIANTVADDVGNACHNSMVRTKAYMNHNPMALVLGALGLGAAVGCLIVLARRPEPTLRDRLTDDPMQLAHDTLCAARDGAGRAIAAIQGNHTARSWSDQLGRVGSNLKFW